MSTSCDAFSHWTRALGHPAGRALLGSLTDAAAGRIAAALADDDAHAENGLVRHALATIAPRRSVEVADVYRHQLTCLAREARWRQGQGTLAGIEVSGSQWLDEVRDRGVVVVMPMQMCTSDAVAAVSACFGDRPAVFFGEGVDAGHYPWLSPSPVFASQGLGGVRQILDVLGRGGVFCTYPDFVYRGRGALPYTFFGRPRSMASAMLSIAMKTGAALLPARARLDMQALQLELGEAVAIGEGIRGEAGLRQLAGVVGSMLEQQVGEDPASWLLLNTLAARSPQMALAS